MLVSRNRRFVRSRLQICFQWMRSWLHWTTLSGAHGSGLRSTQDRTSPALGHERDRPKVDWHSDVGRHRSDLDAIQTRQTHLEEAPWDRRRLRPVVDGVRDAARAFHDAARRDAGGRSLLRGGHLGWQIALRNAAKAGFRLALQACSQAVSKSCRRKFGSSAAIMFTGRCEAMLIDMSS